jgi:hypothetical protein
MMPINSGGSSLYIPDHFSKKLPSVANKLFHEFKLPPTNPFKKPQLAESKTTITKVETKKATKEQIQISMEKCIKTFT